MQIDKRGFLVLDAKKTYFTSDLHFRHKSILKFCDRPFKDIDNMTEGLIKAINDVVPEDADLIHGGDFIWTARKDILGEITSRINCRLHMIFGNHDYDNRMFRPEVRDLFVSTHDILRVKILDEDHPEEYQKAIVSHYPIEHWEGQERGYWHLHGHMHDTPIRLLPFRQNICYDMHKKVLSYYDVQNLITEGALEYAKINNKEYGCIDRYEQ